ncbi:bifunctional lysylphosphatidylglycerol flippase/synthetase MprF [Hephaestia sp. GCM10023244]|uniref:bifunctional lysylphosphatidylglycerol flippase/synthetase MprF n=1 Tax=unclassified Hephaestia TaxID=2631281 RepID=UPI0020779B79|nr:bifunctional lysylphosphatidylglycerol flippase/synthetase MprF [Hephaestia sp. MAHUQ-44]MCM8729880.1 bifunctional lysylphosphatidylglycerol flippase/synthetase MprF [Hephaestia sp. MAHUQ-44]
MANQRLALLKAAQRHPVAIKVTVAAVLATLGFLALHRLLIDVHPRAVAAAFHALGGFQIAAATLFTALSYALLTLYDVIALRIIGKPLPYRTAALASFTSYTLSHNFGLALLTGGSARYRLYSAAGLEAGDIMRIITATGIAFWAGVTVTTAAALLLYPEPFTIGAFTPSLTMQRAVGAVIVLLVVAAIMALRGKTRSFTLFRWRLPRPTPGQAIAQIGIATLDLAAASAALFVLVPGVSLHDFPLFYLTYALAIIAALLSHVPGGIGVFEAVILASLARGDPPALVAALIMYRILYYLLPLAVAAVLLVIHERRQQRQPLAKAVDAAQFVLRGVAPTLLAALVFVGGIVLLVSGSLPAIRARLHILRDIVPLPFVEASHIAASLVGTALLLLAPALYRRLDGGFILCRALLLAGAIFSLTKGVDVEEAMVLLGIAALLQLARPAFYRRTALTSGIVTPRSIVIVALAVALSIWIGFFAFKHVAYQSDLWWQFAWKGDASRFLRASFAISVLLIAATILHLFGHAKQPPGDAATDDEGPETALSYSVRTDAMLALTGDKRFLRSANDKAVLMYQVQGRSWIVMGDPIGPASEWPDLLWQIRERADAAQGRLLLYQISINAVPVAIDLGLHLVKYGEEARVRLEDFTIDGPAMRSLRHAARRAIRDGATFEIVAAANVPAVTDDLRAVSDIWLRMKGHSEKAFSVGRFDPAYLARFDCALVRQHGRLVAFANIWATANREEISVDLMRHGANIPYGTMDFLFVHLMQWAREQGYRWFNLGLAPLSGLDARHLAPMWARAGTALYRHGDAFYGFEGLRAYKEKFGPVWEPRYIAGPYGVGLARGLIDLQTLIGGGANSAARRVRLKLVA